MNVNGSTTASTSGQTFQCVRYTPPQSTSRHSKTPRRKDPPNSSRNQKKLLKSIGLVFLLFQCQNYSVMAAIIAAPPTGNVVSGHNSRGRAATFGGSSANSPLFSQEQSYFGGQVEMYDPSEHYVPQSPPTGYGVDYPVYGGSAGGSTGQSCYSCMSNIYQQLWQLAKYDKIYLRPHAFTDYCSRPAEAPYGQVRMKNCEGFSNCITIVETISIGMGITSYIRGCYDSIFRNGFNRTGEAGKLQYRTTCGLFNSTDLILGQKPKNSIMKVCSCKGALCNRDDTSSGVPHHVVSVWRYMFILIATIYMLSFQI